MIRRGSKVRCRSRVYDYELHERADRRLWSVPAGSSGIVRQTRWQTLDGVRVNILAVVSFGSVTARVNVNALDEVV